MKSRSDNILIQLILGGDNTAFAELVYRHTDKLRACLEKKFQNASEVDDVMQETWCKVFKKLHTFQKRSQFFSWLYRIASNEYGLLLRRKHAKYTHVSFEMLNRVSDKEFETDEFTPFESYLYAEEMELFQRAIDGLSANAREVVDLHYYQGLTTKRISSILRTSNQAVKSRLHAARARLRNLTHMAGL